MGVNGAAGAQPPLYRTSVTRPSDMQAAACGAAARAEVRAWLRLTHFLLGLARTILL